MIRRLLVVAAVFGVTLIPSTASAQRNELGLGLGGMVTSDRTIQLPSSLINVKGSLTYYLNYSHRIADFKLASVHVEFPLAASPSTDIDSSNVLVPRNYSSFFFTPGLKVKFFPVGGVSPYLALGGGLGRFRSSDTLINGQPNTGGKGTNKGVLDYGGGDGTPVLFVPSLINRAHVLDRDGAFYAVLTPDLGGRVLAWLRERRLWGTPAPVFTGPQGPLTVQGIHHVLNRYRPGRTRR